MIVEWFIRVFCGTVITYDTVFTVDFTVFEKSQVAVNHPIDNLSK